MTANSRLSQTDLGIEEYTSATSTDSVVRVFLALNVHVTRRHFHWGQWEKRFFVDKSGAEERSATKFGPRIGGRCLHFFEILARENFP